jgi:hypothetical protein
LFSLFKFEKPVVCLSFLIGFLLFVGGVLPALSGALIIKRLVTVQVGDMRWTSTWILQNRFQMSAWLQSVVGIIRPCHPAAKPSR